MDYDGFYNWLSKRYAQTTIDGTMKYIRRVEIDLDEVEYNYEIAQWVKDLGVSGVSKKHFRKAINNYLEFRNRPFRLRSIKTKLKREIWYPSDEQLQAILKARTDSSFLAHRNYLLVKMLAIGGLSTQEAVTLSKEDIQCVEVVQRALPRYCYVVIRKPARYPRNIPIPERFYVELKDYTKSLGSPGWFLFDNQHGMPMSENRARQICKSLRERVGCPELTPKALRYWRIFDLKKKGIDPVTIARFLGKIPQVQCDDSREPLEKKKHQSQILKNNPLAGLESIFLRDSLFSQKEDVAHSLENNEKMCEIKGVEKT